MCMYWSDRKLHVHVLVRQGTTHTCSGQTGYYMCMYWSDRVPHVHALVRQGTACACTGQIEHYMY